MWVYVLTAISGTASTLAAPHKQSTLRDPQGKAELSCHLGGAGNCNPLR